MPSKISVDEVNNLKGDQFEEVFGNVIELHADAARVVKEERPFSSALEICGAFQRYLDDLSLEGDITLESIYFPYTLIDIISLALCYLILPTGYRVNDLG